VPAALCAPASRPISLSARGRVCVLPVACLAECYTWRRRVRLPGGQLEHRRGARATRGETSAPETHSARARREPAGNKLTQLTCSCSHADAHACPHARARPSLSFRATAAASGSGRTCSAPSCQRPLAPALYGRPTAARTAVCRAADATARPGDQTPLDQPFCGARRQSKHTQNKEPFCANSRLLFFVFVEPVGLYLISILPPSVHD
jgi:hypothetical protein